MIESSPDQTRGITHILFVDLDETKKVAVANASFDSAGNATINLYSDDEGYKVRSVTPTIAATDIPSPEIEPAAPAAIIITPESSAKPNDQLSVEHLAAVLTDIVPKISDGFARLGLPVPKSKAAVDHAAVLAFLRAAVTKALQLPTPIAASIAAPIVVEVTPALDVQVLSSETEQESERNGSVAALLDNGPITSIDGMDRSELETGNKKALKALFATLHARGATAIPSFEAWARAENVWPADNKFTAEVRSLVSAAMLKRIEYPSKIAPGLHESVPTPVKKAA